MWYTVDSEREVLTVKDRKTNQEFVEEIVNECFHCGYHYQEDGDLFPCCHFDGFGLAPCEYEDKETEDVDEDFCDDEEYNAYY